MIQLQWATGSAPRLLFALASVFRQGAGKGWLWYLDNDVFEAIAATSGGAGWHVRCHLALVANILTWFPGKPLPVAINTAHMATIQTRCEHPMHYLAANN